MRRLCLGAAVGALVLVGAAHARMIDRVVALVNDEVVTWSELEEVTGPVLRQIESIPDPLQRDQQREKQLRAGLDELVGQRLVLQEATRRKMSVGVEEVDSYILRVKGQQKWDDPQLDAYVKAQGYSMPDFRAHLKEQILRNKVMRAVLGERVRISDGDVEAYYRDKLTELNSQFELEAAHIVLSIPANASPTDEAAIRQQATELLARAKAGEDFGALAKQYSQGIGAENGGALGAIRRGSLDAAFEDTLFALPDGGVGGPVRTGLGWHVVKAISRQRLPAPSLEEAREKLRQELTDRRMKDEVAQWVEELKKKAFIEVKL